MDSNSGVLTLEFTDGDHMNLNIPVEEEFYAALDMCALMHIGAVKEGKIAQAYQVPLMFLDDPYRADAFKNVKTPDKPLAAFDHFVRKCVLGQPVHRDDAGNEDTIGCILGDAKPSALEFAPHIARRHSIEMSPNAAPNINAPGMGLGGSGSAARTRYNTGNKGTTDKNDQSD